MKLALLIVATALGIAACSYSIALSRSFLWHNLIIWRWLFMTAAVSSGVVLVVAALSDNWWLVPWAPFMLLFFISSIYLSKTAQWKQQQDTQENSELVADLLGDSEEVDLDLEEFRVGIGAMWHEPRGGTTQCPAIMLPLGHDASVSDLVLLAEEHVCNE